MYNKHYDGQGWSGYRGLDKSVTVRLKYDEISILEKHYPCKSLSYAIRSAIHALESSKHDDK